jgi:hypothetical protein
MSLAEIEDELGEGGSEGGIAGERLPGADSDLMAMANIFVLIGL